MPNELDPLPNQWYSYLDKGQRFYVTTIGEAANIIEVQHFDGDLEEFTLEEWRGLNIELSEAPENWTGALDIAERDDLGTGITDTDKRAWDEPLQDFRDAGQEKPVPEPTTLTDDYGEGYMEEEPLEEKSLE